MFSIKQTQISFNQKSNAGKKKTKHKHPAPITKEEKIKTEQHKKEENLQLQVSSQIKFKMNAIKNPLKHEF